MIKILSLISLWLGLWSSLGLSFTPIVMSPGEQRKGLEGFVYHLYDPSDERSVDEILSGRLDPHFVRRTEAGIPIGRSERSAKSDTWLALEVQNLQSEAIALFVYGPSSIGLVRGYRLEPKGTNPPVTLSFQSELPRTPKTLTVPPGHWKFYLEYHREPYGYELVFLSLRTYSHLIHNSPERHIISLSLGICIALLLYNLVLAINLKSRSHWLYVLYNLAIVLYFEANGQVLSEQFGLPDIPPTLWFPINLAALFLFAIFLYDILNIPQNLPGWKRPYQLILLLWPILLVLQHVSLPTAHHLFNVLILLATPVSFAICLQAAFRGNPIAKLLCFTVTLPALGSLFGLLANRFAPWIPTNLIVCLQPLGINLEMIFLSMTIGYKIRRQQLSLKRRRDHAFGELKKIVFPHQVEHIWDGGLLSESMPVGSSKAFTIVFDVIGSSKMPLSDPRTFLSRVFTACSELMMERYDGRRLIANAYRVKEMGDGFICTVGFPFSSPESNGADHALRLSYRFMQIFSEEAQRAGATQPMYCAVGIAFGEIEAFYPENGTQVYDMYGRSIILATRYESMRDFLFPYLNRKENIIVLQKEVYKALSQELGSDFIELDLEGAHFRVKDDESATHLAYRLGPAPLGAYP